MGRVTTVEAPSPWLDPGEDTDETKVSDENFEESPEHDPVAGDRAVVPGPPVPLHLEAAASRNYLLTAPAASSLTVVGLHGGAGVSTLARLLGEDVHDDEEPWQAAHELPAGWVVAVTRIHGRGLSALHDLAEAWSHGRLGSKGRLLGAVLVDDAPKPTKEQIKQARAVAAALPRTWRVPWVEQWRTRTPDEDSPECPRRVRVTTKHIRTAYRDAGNRKDAHS